MEPLQILVIVLVVAGIWLVAELAITARRARRTMAEVDKTVAELNETLAETRPVVAKLDGAVDELQPAIAKVEPLANVAVDALSANLVEIEGVVRDVSAVTGAAASAGNVVSGVADSASEAARKLLGKFKSSPDAGERTLEAAPSEETAEDVPASSEVPQDAAAPSGSYYTYGGSMADDTAVTTHEAPTKEETAHE